MKRFRSIRWRLQLWYGALTGVLLVGFGTTAYHFEKRIELERIDGELRTLMFALSAANRRPGPPADGPTRPARSSRPNRNPQDILTPAHHERGFYYALWTKNGVPFTPSANAPADLPQPADGPPGVRVVGTRREAFLITNPGDVTLLGRDFAVELAELNRLGWKITGAGFLTWIVTLLVGGWLVARALRPIRHIGAAAQKIATGDLSQRIDTHETDSELGQLAGVLNSTFGRLEAAFAQQARFTADAAHELRTPVSVMLTHVQNGLATEGLGDEQREAFEACQRAAQRMRKLIESLLALARLDAGQDALNAADIELNVVAQECVDLVRPMAAMRKIELETDLGPAACRGDGERLAQVATNLLANAIHYNREGGHVRVRTHRKNGHAFLIVADNGPGIASEHLPKIFDRFYRADKARTSAQGRTGLGLAISRAIVEAHGGAIEVASEPGRGATFTVRIPAGG